MKLSVSYFCFLSVFGSYILSLCLSVCVKERKILKVTRLSLSECYDYDGKDDEDIYIYIFLTLCLSLCLCIYIYMCV